MKRGPWTTRGVVEAFIGHRQQPPAPIADAVGLLKGSLYDYIDSKEDLLYGIAQAVNKTVSDGMGRNELLEGPAIERLLAYSIGRPLDWDHVADNYTEFNMQGLWCPSEHSHASPAARRRSVKRTSAGTRRQRAVPGP